MKIRVSLLPMLAIALFAVMSCAHAANITDTGPGSFSDINNAGTLDYVLVDGGASIGNVTNAASGTLNANTLPMAISTACCGSYTFNVGVDNSTVTGGVTNNGAISQTSANNNVTGILISNASSVGGSVTNNNTVTVSAPSNLGIGILIDGPASVAGNVVNTGTITATAAEAIGIENLGTITGGITNSGTITATGVVVFAILNAGNALTVNQNAGAINGDVGLSGSDTFNINAGTVTGSIIGNQGGVANADVVNLTGGTLTLRGGQTVNNIGTYAEAGGDLVFQVSTAGTGSLGANTINLGGTLVIAPQGGGFLTPHTYTNVIAANTTLTGMFTSATSASAGFITSLVADGSNAYDLVVTWSGGAAAHIADIGGGNFADINNTGTLGYIAVTGGGIIGNITNASGGGVNGTETPYVATTCCGIFASSLSVDGSTVAGNITNNGSITQTSDANNVGGIVIANASAVGGNVANNGSITVTTTDNLSIAAGILVDTPASVAGNVVNGVNGTITATANGVNGLAEGIENFASITGGITDSGTISATANGVQGEAFGIGNFAPITGGITNSGTITATANGDLGVDDGIENFDPVTGSLTNSGTITVSANGIQGTAIGIGNSGTITGSLTNSGTITVSADGFAEAIGTFGNITGSLTNSGTITAAANGFAEAIGIENFSTISGGITNSGTITALAPGGIAWAILNHATGLTINQNAGFINGNVGLSGADTFNINGGTVTGSVIGNQASVGVGDAVNLNGGTIAVPTGGSVSGIDSYTQGSGGTLSLAVTPSSSATVSANTITAGGTLKVAPSGGGWALNTPISYIDAIAASSSLSGSFVNVSAPALFTASVTPDGSKAFDLSVTEVSAGSTPAINNFIAGLLGNSNNSPAAQNLANALEGMTGPQLQSAITQLKGPAVAQSIQAVRGVSSDFAGMVQQRILTGGAYDASDLLSLKMVGQHVQMASLAETPLFALAPDPKGGAWMRGFGSFASGAAQGGVAGFNQDRGGVIFGFDQKLNDHWTLGLAAQYAHSSLSFADGSASSDADSYNGIVYGGWHQDRLYVNGTAGFGWNAYNSSRSLDVGGFTANPSGSFSGQNYTASTETGYAFHAGDDQIGDWTLTPYAGLDYTFTHTDAFTESGDGVSNLAVQAGHSNSLITSLGIRTATKIETQDNGTFTPEVHLAWEHENLDENQNINAAFVSSPGNVFSVTSAQYGRDSAIVGAAVTQELSRHSRVFLTYDARLNGGYTEQAISGGVSFEF
jgi:fibronectin-binding autotransporter adhesin